MILQFLAPSESETPLVRFYNGITQVGDLAGYAATEISPMLYEVDVDTDLDAFDTQLIRVVITSPDSVGYVLVDMGETVTLFSQSTAELVEYGLTNLATNIANAIVSGLAGVTPQIILPFDPNNPQTIVVVRRDDYNVLDGRQIDIPFTSPDDFDPIGATGAFGAVQVGRLTNPASFVGSVTPVLISGDWYARVQFTSEQLTVPAGSYDCDIELKKNDRRITVFSGRITVLNDFAQA